MGFSVALSGLTAASKDLQVTGNNIANANSTGFKLSRAEFADVMNGTSSTTAGSGAAVTEVAQQFDQGNIENTNNVLDMAISGNGFFALGDKATSDSPGTYTRNGAFQLDKNGYMITDDGLFLMGYKPNSDNVKDGFKQAAFTSLKVDTSLGLPKATSSRITSINLDVRETPPTVTPFDLANSKSYNATTTSTIYDSQGKSHLLSSYFVKDSTANSWTSYTYLDNRGINVDGSVTAVGVNPTTMTVTFDTVGKLSNVYATGGAVPSPGVNSFDYPAINMTSIDATTTVNSLPLKLDFDSSTQLSALFTVSKVEQDGLPTGEFTGLEISELGEVIARYSNGSTKPIAQVALASFTSNQALNKIGGSNWQESAGSGAVVFGVAGGNNLGTIASQSLENSNVDLSQQLVHLIIAQQAYQASSQSITTEKTLMQTILNA